MGPRLHFQELCESLPGISMQQKEGPKAITKTTGKDPQEWQSKKSLEDGRWAIAHASGSKVITRPQIQVSETPVITGALCNLKLRTAP